MTPRCCFATLALASTWLLAANAIDQAAAADIRIGVAVPMSGRMAPTGTAMAAAIERVAADLNATRGLLGQSLVVSSKDDACAAASAEGAARELAAEHVAVVFGHPCSNAAAAATPVYGTAGILLMAVGPRHPDATHTKTPSLVTALRVAGRDDRQGKAAAAWLFDNAPTHRMAIVHDRTAYARAIVAGIEDDLKISAVTPVAVLPIVAAKRDYSDVAAKLKESGAEAVVFAGYPEEAAVVLSALETAGLAIPFLGTDALATTDFAARAAKAKLRVQILLPNEIHPRRPNGDIDTEIREPDASAARARGAFEAWIEAAKRIGSTDAAAIAQALRERPTQTHAIGEIEFDQSGDLEIASFVTASPHSGQWQLDE